MSRKRPGVLFPYSPDDLRALHMGLDSQLFVVAAILATTQEGLLDMDEAVDDALDLKRAILGRLMQ